MSFVSVLIIHEFSNSKVVVLSKIKIKLRKIHNEFGAFLSFSSLGHHWI